MAFLWWDVYGSCSYMVPVVEYSLIILPLYLHLHLVTIASLVIVITLQCSAWPVDPLSLSKEGR